MPIKFSSGRGRLDTIAKANTFPLIRDEVRRATSSTIRFRDLLSADEVGHRKTDFLKWFEQFDKDVGCSPHDLSTKPYCIWDLMLATDGELRKLISIPDEYQQGYVWKITGNSAAFSVTITLPGSIAEPHMDQAGSASLLNELLGRKLFVVWPPTPNNLKWFSDKYGSFSGSIFDIALEQLEEPYCLMLEQGGYELLPPGHIHGVLSPRNSAVAGVPIVHSNLRDLAERVLKWESELMERLRKGSPAAMKLAHGIEIGVFDDRELWKRLDGEISSHFIVE